MVPASRESFHPQQWVNDPVANVRWVERPTHAIWKDQARGSTGKELLYKSSYLWGDVNKAHRVRRLEFWGQLLALRLLDDTDRGEDVQQVLDFKAEKLTDAAPCGGCEDHEHPVLWTLDPGKLCHGFRRDRWSPLLRGFYERQVQFVCIPFLRIEWVAVRIFSRCNDRSCHAKVGIDRLR